MSTLIEDERALSAAIAGAEEALVLFYASWCPFSRAFLPVYEQHACGPDCYRVLTDSVPAAETAHAIDFVPTVILFRKGRKYARLDGIPGEGLREHLLLDFMQSCRGCRPPREGEQGK